MGETVNVPVAAPVYFLLPDLGVTVTVAVPAFTLSAYVAVRWACVFSGSKLSKNFSSAEKTWNFTFFAVPS